jgi:hypothetical protein
MNKNPKPKNKQVLDPEEAAAKAALLAECKTLARAGVTFVAAHFNGYGDEGVTENVRCYDTKDYDYGSRPIKHDASYLQDHFEALAPEGYENNSGGFGDVVLDVKARKIIVEHSDRIEDLVTRTYEI